MKEEKKIKVIKLYLNGKLINNRVGKVINNIPHITFLTMPKKRKVVKVYYYRTPKELKNE